MAIYKIEQQQPQLNQYCFVKVPDDWKFCVYQGQEESEHKWGFFQNPSKWAAEKITEWQPASLNLANPGIDFANRKVTMDLIDIHNEEKESMYEIFKRSIMVENYDEPNPSGNNSDIEIGRQEVSREISDV